MLELLLRPVLLCYTTCIRNQRRNCHMKEVKPSKKPLAIYYAIVLAVLLLQAASPLRALAAQLQLLLLAAQQSGAATRSLPG